MLDSPRCIRWKRRAEEGEAAGRLMDEGVDPLSHARHRVQRTHGRGRSFGSTHQVLHGATRTMRWYRNLFYHFLDITTTNSYILHKELCLAKETKSLSHKPFLEELTADLCGKPLQSTPAQARADHHPVPVADISKSSVTMKATTGRKQCGHCLIKEWHKDTPWKCGKWQVALCVQT